MKAKKIAFTGIPVTDIKRARAFYEGVLGLKVSREFGEGVWIEYEIGPDTLAIGSVGDQWKPSEDGTSVAIEVEDFDAAIKSLKQRRLDLPPKESRVRCAGWPWCRTRTVIRLLSTN